MGLNDEGEVAMVVVRKTRSVGGFALPSTEGEDCASVVEVGVSAGPSMER